MNSPIQLLNIEDINSHLKNACESSKRRYPKIMHATGDNFNHVFNFMIYDSFMQPHMHPSDEKVEKISIVQGEVVIFYFNSLGKIISQFHLRKGGIEFVDVPPFVWHTYVILDEFAITYETMLGVYDPSTWKKVAKWAPEEGTNEAMGYLKSLKQQVFK